jgi:hypothetical protein
MMHTGSVRRLAVSLIVALLAVAAVACSTPRQDAAPADRLASGPVDGEPPGIAGTLVSMGDSYISGTAGRWRGNSNGFTNLPANLSAFQRSDTGADAYLKTLGDIQRINGRLGHEKHGIAILLGTCLKTKSGPTGVVKRHCLVATPQNTFAILSADHEARFFDVRKY